jgi:hypothetical protein
MAQFYLNPDSYSDEEIEDIKMFTITEGKIQVLLDTIEAIQPLGESKFDLEFKITEKLSRLIDNL